MSGGAIIGLAIIIALVILFILEFIYIYAWLAVLFLFFGSLITLMQGG